ncbi:esterase-like activity of phytase family protein [Anseongella ginsenosidimutans]|nr:esterase-like activity of phytase family protein [Anseongella ginsenosidimutans]QEC53288.1 esterase-like activity of phytase family protein [Anseongella ginsenosidimutans]
MRAVRRKINLLLFVILLCQACQEGTELPPLEPQYPYPEEFVSLSGQEVIARNRKGTGVFNGGFGSSIVAVPGEEGAFYLLTDRGPVVDAANPDEKVFIAKRFNPHIAKYKLAGDSMRMSLRISLNMPAGEASGIPNPPVNDVPGLGATGEIALDTLGRVIEPDPNGIDPEGLAVARDGTFWVSEEYGPSLLHFSGGGQLLEKLTPFEADSDAILLPRVFARRQAGRGLEGLTFTTDGKRLAAIMQAPLNNPNAAAGAGSQNTRILLIDPETGESVQYIYPMLNDGTLVCDIRAISNTSFLVLERDDKLPGDPADPARYKHIYLVDISEASDISDPENGEAGKLVNGKTMEELSEAELASAGIKTVSKELLVDLLKEFPDYPHDKPEGLALISSRKIAVINDDDYGIRSQAPADGSYVPKILPLSETIDRTMIYFIELPSPILP